MPPPHRRRRGRLAWSRRLWSCWAGGSERRRSPWGSTSFEAGTPTSRVCRCTQPTRSPRITSNQPPDRLGKTEGTPDIKADLSQPPLLQVAEEPRKADRYPDVLRGLNGFPRVPLV